MSQPPHLSAIEIRYATESDIPELAHLRWVFHQNDDSDETEQEFIARCTSWFESSLNSGRWRIVIAAAPSHFICGCAFLQIINKVPSPGITNSAWGYITNSYVCSSHRDNGIGGHILQQIIETAKALELELLLVWPSVEAVPFYQRHGFKDVEKAHGHPDDYPPMELVF